MRFPVIRHLSRAAAILLVLSAVVFVALELRLSGPLGISAHVLYRTLRVFVRDATIPTPPPVPEFSNSGPNAIIIVLDCYRLDYLEGGARALSAFAERAWEFDRYYAAASWTKPSTVSLFTGLLVRKHFVIQGGGSQLPPEALTLAELLKERGFSTAGFVWNPHLTRRQAFDQGFDHYVDRARKGSKSLLYEFFSWLDRERPERFFAYVHFQGTHDPYYDDNDLSAVLSAPAYPGDFAFHTIDYKHAVRDGRALSAEEAAHLKHVAEGVARKVDRQVVGGFLERFDASSLPENTLLVITSDHGDAFFEHAAVSHGTTVYNEEVHVPLVMHFPPRFARSRSFPSVGKTSCPASTVDLLPTVMDFVGAPTPPGIDGVSLVPGRGGEGACSRTIVSERTFDGKVTGAAVVSESLKLIVDYEGGRAPELFDLSSDPGETRDLSRELAGQAASLERELRRLLNDDGSSMAEWSEVRGTIPEEQREALRALGYLD